MDWVAIGFKVLLWFLVAYIIGKWLWDMVEVREVGGDGNV